MACRRAANRKRRASRAAQAASTPTNGATRSSPSSRLLAGARPPLLDARGKAAFEGSEADPRPGVAARPHPRRPEPAFASLYARTAVQVARGAPAPVRRGRHRPGAPFIASCGSGVTANSLIFAAHCSATTGRGCTTEAGANGAPTRRPQGGRVRPRRGRSRRRRAARGGSGRPASGSRPRAARGPRARSVSSASTPAAAAPTSRSERLVEQRCARFARIVPARRRSLIVVAVGGRPPPNGSTSRSAWRMLASRDTASA